MSRCIAKAMNLEKPKQPTFWSGGSINFSLGNMTLD